MFFTSMFSDQQITILYGVATFLTVAPVVIASAAFAGHVWRLNHPTE